MNFVGSIFLLILPAILCQDTRNFKQFIDTRVNPCEDFHQYACGKWTPSNDEALDVITDQKLKNRLTIKNHFANQRRNDIRLNPASQFYHLCVTSKYQSKDEILQSYLGKLMEISEWPYVNATFRASSFDWLKVAAILRRYKVQTIFRLIVHRNWKDSSQWLIYLAPIDKLFSGPADGDDAFIYKTYIKNLLLGFGVRVRKANLIAQEVVKLEMDLNELSQSAEDELEDPISLAVLMRRVPEINWKLYMETILGGRIKLSQEVIVGTEYFKKLKTLLNRTKPETIALMQLSRFMLHYEVNMDRPDWMSCIDEVSSKMPLLISREFMSLRKPFSPSKIMKVFENIREEFLQQINETSWYDYELRNESVNKLKAIKILIGHPELEESNQPAIQIDPTSYEKSKLLLDKISFENELKLLSQPSELSNANLRPLNVNAYYRLTSNTLEIPVGILQPPMYREDSDFAQIMGSLGSILAHEILHGFDGDGQRYDPRGNAKTEINRKGFVQFGVRSACFLDQYRGGNVLALNEDIADNEGLRLAYGAYERLKQDHPYVDTATRPHVTGDQLFFISFAQIWCQSEEGPRKLREHSSHKDRANNAVSNSEAFAKAFSCSPRSPLNPSKRCQIW